MLPEGWKIEPLGNVIKHKKGFAFKRSDYKQDGVRLFRVSDATENNRNNGEAIWISEETANRYCDYRLKTGDIIVSTVGSRPPLYDSMVGRAIKISETSKGWLLNQNQVKLTVQEMVLPDYLYYHLKTKRFILFIESLIRGNANQVSITLDELFCFEVPYPNTEEQEIIIKILNTWDTAIAQTERLIAAKQKLKKGLMWQLLRGKRRRKKYNDSWTKLSLKKACNKIFSGGTPNTNIDSYWSGDIPWVTGADFSDNGIPAFRRFITDDAVANSSTRVAVKNSILIVSRTGVGKIAIAPCHIAISQDITSLEFSECVSPEFAFFAIQATLSELERYNQGTSINGIKRNDLVEHSILFPTIPEQKEIVNILNGISNDIQLLKSITDKLKKQKRGLMQKLLTGQVRVKR